MEYYNDKLRKSKKTICATCKVIANVADLIGSISMSGILFL